MKKIALALLFAGTAMAPAKAVVVNFDDLAGMGVLAANYGGINWGNNWRFFDTVQSPYTPASGTQRIFRNYAVWGVGAAAIPFTFTSAVVFNGASISGHATNPVTFLLYNNSSLVHTSTVFTPSSIPTFAASGYGGLVDEVRVSSQQIMTLDDIAYTLGGGNGGNGSNDEPTGPGVPEPGTWAMLIAGFGLAGAVLRRRRAVIA